MDLAVSSGCVGGQRSPFAVCSQEPQSRAAPSGNKNSYFCVGCFRYSRGRYSFDNLSLIPDRGNKNNTYFILLFIFNSDTINLPKEYIAKKEYNYIYIEKKNEINDLSYNSDITRS